MPKDITIEFPTDVPPGASAEVQKVAEKYGGYIVQDETEVPGEPIAPAGPPPAPPMAPGEAGAVMGSQGAFGLRPPGL